MVSEILLKRSARAAAHWEPLRRFSFLQYMEVYVYSDESGTFDYVHNDYFVYGGVIFLSKAAKEEMSRKYLALERKIRADGHFGIDEEIKASKLKKSHKRRLLSLSYSEGCYPFGIVISLKELTLKEQISSSSKSKQRYMDYAYKLGIKNMLKSFIETGLLPLDECHSLHFCMDEHHSATDGKYELSESLDAEFNIGTYNPSWDLFHKPIFEKRKAYIDCRFCDSKRNTLVRLADIVANYIFHKALELRLFESLDKGFGLLLLPKNKFYRRLYLPFTKGNAISSINHTA